MARIGMDADVVESVGRQLKHQGQSVTSVIRAVDALIDRAGTNWWGAHGRDVVHQWRTLHRPALLRVAGAVDGLGSSALANASEQRTASSSSGANAGAAQAGPGLWRYSEGVATLASVDKALNGWMVTPGLAALGTLGVLTGTWRSKPYPAAYSALFGKSEFMRYNSSLGDTYVKQLGRFTDSAPMKGLGYLGAGFTVASQSVNLYSNFGPGSEASVGDRIEAGGAAAGSALKMSKNPVAYLSGAAITAWSMTANEATKVDYSSSGLHQTWEYMRANPGVIGEELARSGKEMVTDRLWRILG